MDGGRCGSGDGVACMLIVIPRSSLPFRKVHAGQSATDFKSRGSTLLVRVEDVVLRLHWRMARVSAVREAFGVGGELVRGSIVVEDSVSPPAAFRESLAVLFHDESLLKDVWHVHDEGGLGALLGLP